MTSASDSISRLIEVTQRVTLPLSDVENRAMDLFRLVCFLLYTALPTVRTQGKRACRVNVWHELAARFDDPYSFLTAQCNGQSDISPWEGIQLVWYKCDSWMYYYYICQDSGWGDEEATVVCREQGYSHGTSGE